MKSNFLKNTATAVLMAVLSMSAFSLRAADAADEPVVITLKSNIYGYQGPENSFTIYLGSTEKDCEFFVSGPRAEEYIYVDPFTLGKDEDGSNMAIATAVHISVTETDNEVRIYGDASKLDYIDVHGCYLSSIELSPALTNLAVIDLSHNELTAIDLSPFVNLASIDLLDNAFTDPKAMKIGTNHPGLGILSVGINDVIDPELNLRNFPALQYFSARNNFGLTEVDPSGCPDLVSLVLEVTNITSLDVSKNTKLDVLNISNTKINSIDISKNTRLGEFYASHEGSYNVDDAYKFTQIDVTKNPSLQYLDLGGNKLTEIDLSKNPNLRLLYLQKNRLSDIDLSNNTMLATVNLSNNLFTFATLPLPVPGWDYYYYRSPLACNFKYKVGEAIDFSKEVIRAPYTDAIGNVISPATYATVFAEPRAGDIYEIEESLYTYKDGVITFHEAIPDSVYVEFYCTAFPDWTMQSATFKVKTEADFDAPSTAFVFTPAAEMNGKDIEFTMSVRPQVAGVQYPADITLFAGSTVIEKKGALTSSAPAVISFTLPAISGSVTVGVTDGFTMTSLAIDNVALAAIDLSQASEMTSLSLTDCRLPSIDLGYNGALRTLDLHGNALSSFSLSAVRGDYEKFYLKSVNLADNRLSRISATIYEVIEDLNLSGNLFTDFDFRYYKGLRNLDMSRNRLSSELDLTGIDGLRSLNAADNMLTAIALGDTRNVVELNLVRNNLSFASLPLPKTGMTYAYAPQNPYSILSAGAAINLSDQNVGGATKYAWKYSDTKQDVESSLLTIENGVTRFSEALYDKSVFCEMTNPAFPDFNSQPLTTTSMTILDAPSNLVASFTPATSGPVQIGFRFNKPGANAVYIDWNGDGSQYQPYIYDTTNTAIYRDGQAVAGKTAKVYTYSDPSEVSMLFTMNMKMLDFDATPMTKAEAFDIHQAGLTDGSIHLPQSDLLEELVLDGSAFETQTFADFPSIRTLNLAENRYKEIDLSSYPNLLTVQLSSNRIEKITFGPDNADIYQLDLTGNRLADIDLSELTYMGELLLADNLLTELDITPVKDYLLALNIAGNYFTFKTLPRAADFNPMWFHVYYYANQHPFNVECRNGMVDLSEQAKVGDKETVYRWFLADKQSDVYYDDYYEMIMGEELEGPDVSDDPEYSVTEGVTSFHYKQNRRVVCAMTNEEYPNLVLFTTPTEIDAVAAVENIAVDSENAPVDVYNMSGVAIRRQVSPAEATRGLTPGLYIVGNKKVLVR